MKWSSHQMMGLSILLLSLLVGCEPRQASGDPVSGSAIEEEHAEHYVPPHKPQTFVSLVEQLALRFDVLSDLGRRDNDEFVQKSDELADILTWVPELAADSNLMRSDFDAAVFEGRKLMDVFLHSDRGRNLKGGDVRDSLDVLKKLAPQSVEPPLE